MKLILSKLGSSLQANAKFHRALEVSNFGKVHGENLDRHNALPFSSIKDIAAIVDDLSEQVVKLRTETSGSEMKLGELQSRILKSR